MIIYEGDYPLRMIGIPDSSITHDAAYAIKVEHAGDFEIITPDEFLSLADRTQYQYMVMFTLDRELRKKIIDIIESTNLKCFTYIDKTVVMNGNPANMIGHGTFISPFSSIMIEAKVGKHCLVEAYCLLAHYSELGDNVILHSGTMIAGKTKIGKHSMFNFRSSALNKLTICEDVEIGALSCVTKDIDKPGRYVGTQARYVGDRIPFREDNV